MSLLQINAYVCRDCGWTDFHPVRRCPRCKGEIVQEILPGKGKIVTFTQIRYPPKGFETQAPYVIAIIDIHNGPRVIGRISNSYDGLKIGSMVSLTASKQDHLVFQTAT